MDQEGMQQGEEFPVIQQRPTPRAGLSCAVMETEVMSPDRVPWTLDTESFDSGSPPSCLLNS